MRYCNPKWAMFGSPASIMCSFFSDRIVTRRFFKSISKDFVAMKYDNVYFSNEELQNLYSNGTKVTKCGIIGNHGRSCDRM